MLNKEEMRVLVEREGISEFFNVIDCVYLESAECTLYELETDYYAVMFRIFPPAYTGPLTEDVISSALTCGLPINSIVQFHQISSKNINEHKENYDDSIVEEIEELKLKNPQMLKELHNAHMNFLKEHVENTVFKKTKLAFYIRDFINTVTVLFPMRNEYNKVIDTQDLIPSINKLKGSMYTMYPCDINEHQYIRIMRELLTPYNPIRDCYRDPNVDIRDHFTDTDSILVNEGKGVVKLCPSSEIHFEKQDEDAQKKKMSIIDKLLIFFKKFKKDNIVEKTPKSKDSKTISKDTFFVKVLSRKMFPQYADLNSITDLSMDYFDTNVQQQMPLPYVIALTVKIEDTEKVISAVKDSAMWNKWQLDNVGKLADYFPELKMRAAEADDIINVIDGYGKIPMKASWTMLIYSKDKDELDYHTTITKSNYQRKGFILQEEDLITVSVFMYSMPMKYDEIYREFSRRFRTVFDANVASVAPLGTDSRGFGSDAVIQLFGRNGQPQNFDLYDKNATNKNAVIVAPSGKGKSFFTQRLVWSYLKNGAKIRIVDSGHSYRSLCDSIGGQYITFPDGNDICINPFSEARLDPDGNLNEDEISNISNLIGIMAGYDLAENGTNVDAELVNILTSYIAEAVVTAFKSSDEPGMEEVGDALKNKLIHIKQTAEVEGNIRDGDIDRRLPSLIVALHDFISKDGAYYNYVNGPANITFNSSLVVLDLDDLNAKQKRFKDFVLSTVTNTIEREFYKERDNGQRKLFMIDEAWTLLDGKSGSVILMLYQRARKMRGSIITITQSINHFYMNDKIKGIFENAYWRLFLEQDSSTITTAMDEKKLIIDEYAFELLKTVKTRVGEYSEVMIMTEPGDLMIGRTLSTRVEYWISTQDEKDVNFAASIASSYNISNVQARLAIGFSEMNQTDIEQEITRLLGYEDIAVDELLKEEV